MRKDSDFYEKFSGLRELIVDLPFEEEVSIESRWNAFCSLVDLLIKKGIYKNDGTIQKWRENSIQYLKDVIDSLEESDLQQILTDQKQFFDRFIFTPCGKNSSVFAALRERIGMNENIFCDIPITILFQHFTEITGKSAYEKIPTSVAQNFLYEVENFR